jgi:hypothetical protein
VPDDWLTDTIISLFFAGRARFLSTIYTSGHTGYDSDPFGHPSQHRQRQPSKRGAHTVKAIRSPGTPANRKEAPGSHRLYLSSFYLLYLSLVSSPPTHYQPLFRMHTTLPCINTPYNTPQCHATYLNSSDELWKNIWTVILATL